MAGARYLLLVAGNPWPPVNSLWASLRHRGFRPDGLWLLVNPEERPVAEAVGRMAALLFRELGLEVGIEIVEVPRFDPAPVAAAVRRLVEEAKAKGARVALDVTPVRKLMALGAATAALAAGVDHLFYTFLEDVEGADRPYAMLPFEILHPLDFGGGPP